MSAVPIPAGQEEPTFRAMLALRGLTVRGSVAADREYAELICEQFDDDQPVDEVVADVAAGTGLDWESTVFVLWAAVVCFRPEHADAVLPPFVAR